MNLLNRQTKQNNILSTMKPKEPILDINYNSNVELQTKLRQKKQLIIYIDNNKYFVDHAAAYALGIVNTRAVMLETPKMVEISYDMHAKLCNNDEIEIQYITIEKSKEKLRVFYEESSLCIENSAAYALGLLTVEEFHNSAAGYYYITEDILNNLKANYDIEMSSLKLFEEESNKKM